jgi:very-long-chain ceramide synthase
MYKGYPLIEHVDGIKYFFLATLGYHLYRTYDQLSATTRHKDFVEMLLHHALTAILYTGSYLMNNISIGMLVVYACDTTDMFVHFAKGLSCSTFKKSCNFFGLGMWMCWFW